MRLRYLARINLDQLPKERLPLTPENVGQVLDTNGWTVTGQELRMYGHEYWVTLEREITTPLSKHPACTIEGAPR